MTDFDQWEDATKIAVLRTEINNLQAELKEFREVMKELYSRLDKLGTRQEDHCRNCETWDRIRDLEIDMAGVKATARGWALGAGAIAGAVGFLAHYFFIS